MELLLCKSLFLFENETIVQCMQNSSRFELYYTIYSFWSMKYEFFLRLQSVASLSFVLVTFIHPYKFPSVFFNSPATRILKKKKLKINMHRPVGTRVVFDEEGNTLPPLAALADRSSGNGFVRHDLGKLLHPSKLIVYCWGERKQIPPYVWIWDYLTWTHNSSKLSG